MLGGRELRALERELAAADAALAVARSHAACGEAREARLRTELAAAGAASAASAARENVLRAELVALKEAAEAAAAAVTPAAAAAPAPTPPAGEGRGGACAGCEAVRAELADARSGLRALRRLVAVLKAQRAHLEAARLLGGPPAALSRSRGNGVAAGGAGVRG